MPNAKYPKPNAAKYNVYRRPGPSIRKTRCKGVIGKLRKVYHIAKRGVQPAELWENETYLVATTNGTSWMDVGLKADIKRPCPWMNTTGKREAIAVYREYARRFRAKGWMDRAFLYAYDEPFGKKKLYAGREQAEFFREAVPDGWALVTNTWSPELDGACNLWCVPVNWFDDGEHATADEIKKRQDKGERVWWYHAMMSRGEPLHKGGRWPSYFIDDSAMAARITGFFTWRYNFQGFLYYLTTMAYTKGNNPWRNQFYFDANGDGTLFYPGTPDRVGGSRIYRSHPFASASTGSREGLRVPGTRRRPGDKALADRIAAELGNHRTSSPRTTITPGSTPPASRCRRIEEPAGEIRSTILNRTRILNPFPECAIMFHTQEKEQRWRNQPIHRENPIYRRQPFRVTIIHDGEEQVVEVRPEDIPYGRTGLPGSILDIWKGTTSNGAYQGGVAPAVRATLCQGRRRLLQRGR